MTGNIAADVEHVIATTCAADAQERLMSCVPMLEEAIENWRCGPDTAPPGSLVDDLPSRRVRPDIFTREQALELAKAFARAERDKDGSET